MFTMQVLSSITTMPPEPMMAPVAEQGLVVDESIQQGGRDAAAGGAAHLHGLDTAGRS